MRDRILDTTKAIIITTIIMFIVVVAIFIFAPAYKATNYISVPPLEAERSYEIDHSIGVMIFRDKRTETLCYIAPQGMSCAHRPDIFNDK